jgi:predicted Zn-dependent peptidase
MKINKHCFPNGLRLVHYEDTSTQMVALNIVYDVGARDEHPEHTGFAHLFEHLMFGGSAHIPDYDTPLQLAGGENNAWTNNDITNYYLTVPKPNVETAFWLESDRMLGSISSVSLIFFSRMKKKLSLYEKLSILP